MNESRTKNPFFQMKERERQESGEREEGEKGNEEDEGGWGSWGVGVFMLEPARILAPSPMPRDMHNLPSFPSCSLKRKS